MRIEQRIRCLARRFHCLPFVVAAFLTAGFDPFILARGGAMAKTAANIATRVIDAPIARRVFATPAVARVEGLNAPAALGASGRFFGSD